MDQVSGDSLPGDAFSKFGELDPVLKGAIAAIQDPSQPHPPASQVVAALVALEKTTKAAHFRYNYGQLLGTWRLGFVTGTRKGQGRKGIALGKGFFLPDWVKATLTYRDRPLPPWAGFGAAPLEQTSVFNRVQWGAIALEVSGPTQLHQGRMLGFDFTRLQVDLGGWYPYRGAMGRGVKGEANFYDRGVKNQAFFTYFWVSPQAIAARGRGGGFALWVSYP
jgi:hypothetical protein